MTTLNDLNPSNSFEVKLLEVLKSGVPSSGVSEDFAAAVEAIVNKVIALESRVSEMERKMHVITTAIKEEAGG